MSLYHVGYWGTNPNYQCSLCPFSTMIKRRIENHIDGRHAGGHTLVQVADVNEEVML